MNDDHKGMKEGNRVWRRGHEMVTRERKKGTESGGGGEWSQERKESRTVTRCIGGKGRRLSWKGKGLTMEGKRRMMD
jgi:hypothetical protein